ncbi:hypothetical protein, partial [Cellulomonas bogoriensis]|uniref:hypothetical protein n=1 Tax=Cellulomonas bogoriensis TaxID=301388 RepID=UPI00054CD8CD
AIWQWHDGERDGAATEATAGLPEIIPGSWFVDLDAALADTRELHGLCGDDVTLQDPDSTEEEKDFLWRPEFVLLLGSETPLVAEPHPTHGTSVHRFDPQGQYSLTAHMTIPEVINHWHHYLDTGAWTINDHGNWEIDLTRYPTIPHHLPIAEQGKLTGRY